MEKQLNSSGKISQDIHHCQFLKTSKKAWQEEQSARRVRGREHFMLMFNDIDWKKNDENGISNAEKVKNYTMKFSQGHWTFLGHWTCLGLGSVEKWYGSSSYAQEGEWGFCSQQNGTAIQRNWSLCVQKYQCFWVVGSWSRRRVKIPYTSMEIQQTQNSCSKQFILWIGPASTEQCELVLPIRLDGGRKGTSQFICGQKCVDKCTTLKKYNSWYLLRQRHLETFYKKTLWASKHCPVEFGPHNCSGSSNRENSDSVNCQTCDRAFCEWNSWSQRRAQVQ